MKKTNIIKKEYYYEKDCTICLNAQIFDHNES